MSIPTLANEEALKAAAATKCVVHFAADWYEPCQHVNALLSQRLKTDDRLPIYLIDTEETADFAAGFNIQSVPTFIAFQGGKEQERLEGMDPPALIALLDKYSSANAGGTGSAKATANALDQVKGDLNMRLAALVKRAPVMVFMKGNPAAVKCKFSKELMGILAEQGVVFDTFDILSDEEVRQGLKTYSNWATYPQIYLNGSLIGGVDIIKEMVEDDEMDSLKNAAPPAAPGALPLDERLKALVKQAPVMLFMKGNRAEPRCGFSAKIVGILNEQSVSYETFDILGDEEVRQGLKEFSNWPTYPQLYSNGTLLGGLDIVQELVEGDELQDALDC